MALVEKAAGRALRLHGRRVTKEELYKFIQTLIAKGNTDTSAIAPHLGKTTKQTKRILNEMAALGMVQTDPNTHRLVKTVQQQTADDYKALDGDDFAKLEEIQYYIKECKARGVKPRILYGYVHALKQIFNFMDTRPRTILPDPDMPDAPPTFGSRSTAIAFAKNLTLAVQEKLGKPEPNQRWRVCLRNLYDVYGLSFGHGMARQYGIGSHHDRFQPYAGAYIPLVVCEKIAADLLLDKDYIAYAWFWIGIMTAARSSAMSTMIWSRINLAADNFEVHQHETKDDTARKRGNDLHLGALGEWHIKHPPSKLREILVDYKENHAPKNSNFLWFDDAGSDIANRKQAKNIRDVVIPNLRQRILKYRSELDAVTIECIEVGQKVGHLLRHTYAQLGKEFGMKDEQIADGIWKGTQTLAWYSTISAKDKAEKRTMLEAIHSKKTEDVPQ